MGAALRNGPQIVVAALVAAGLIGALVLGQGARDREIDASVLGVRTLAPWLRSQGMAVERSNPRLNPLAETIALRIIPLYDVDLFSTQDPPTTQAEAYFAPTLREIEHEDLIYRLDWVPTLIVLPKWVAGTVEGRIAHPATRIPPRELARLMRQIGYQGIELPPPGDGFLKAALPEGTLALFSPQLFQTGSLPRSCTAEVSFPEGILLARCDGPKSKGSVYVLSDPDVLNNHGLTVADNALVAAGLVKGILGPDGTGDEDHFVYLDTSPEDLVDYEGSAAERRDYTRGAAEFERFFAPPLAGMWATLLIVLGLAFWRGAVRFGPVRADGAALPEQSRIVALATNARLLRMAGHDGRMAADFVQNGLTDLARQTFGPAYGSGPAGRERLFSHLARRDPDATGAFRAAADAVMQRAAQMTPADLRRHLDTYCSLLEKLTHADDADGLPRPR